MGDLFNAAPNDRIVQGHCIVIDDDGEIRYGGPIKGAPEVSGALVLLHPSDFEKLKRSVETRRH